MYIYFDKYDFLNFILQSYRISNPRYKEVDNST
jgi:hypothetical protein